MNVIIKVMNIIKQKSYSAVIYYITQVTRYRMVYINPRGEGGGSSKRRRGWGPENSPPDCITADQWECMDTNRVHVVFEH